MKINRGGPLLLLLSATAGRSSAADLEQYTPDLANWTTLNEKSVLNNPKNPDHTPDGVSWIGREDWIPWDGTVYNASEYSRRDLAELICPGNTIRGMREAFYGADPFADPVNPTKAEVDAWHAVAINHVRAMVGYSEPEYQVEPDKCLHVRALWSDERKNTRMWDDKYPGGCEGTTNPHCGAGFIPDREDQGPYLPDGIDYCGSTAGSEGLFNSAKASIPWSIRWIRPLCYTLGAEGFWGGHTAPWFHRKKFGFSWRDVDPENSNSNANLRAKWSGPRAPNKYVDPRIANRDHLILAEGVDPDPRFPGFECERRVWMSGGSPNATDCYRRVMDGPDCGKRFVTYISGSGGCACYPVDMEACDPKKVAGRATWDLEPRGNSFGGLMVDPEDPLWSGRRCNNILWKFKAGDAAHCLQKLMEAQFPDCGRRFMTWNSANGGCACYPPEQLTCEMSDTRRESGRMTFELLEDPSYELPTTTVPTTSPVSTAGPTASPMTAGPTASTSPTAGPTASPATAGPTASTSPTAGPTTSPTTTGPTASTSPTAGPTTSPTTAGPTASTSPTAGPTTSPTTAGPTASTSPTAGPTTSPTTAGPTASASPTAGPTTSPTTAGPTASTSLTAGPTAAPVTAGPSAAPTAGPTACGDDPGWHREGIPQHSCDIVARNPAKFCKWMGEEGIRAFNACRKACDSCGCRDDPYWRREGNPGHGCHTVASRNTANRCEWMGENGIQASVACKKTCGSCGPTTPEPTPAPTTAGTTSCVDDPDWRKKNRPDHSCRSVGIKDTEVRCEKWKDEKGVPASVACKKTCDSCATAGPTAAPTACDADATVKVVLLNGVDKGIITDEEADLLLGLLGSE